MKTLLSKNSGIDANSLEKAFYSTFPKIAKSKFVKNGNNESVVNALSLYFAQDERFYDHSAITLLDNSVADLTRGIALFGANGNGKTTIMRVYSHLLRNCDLRFNIKDVSSLIEEYQDPDPCYDFNMRYNNYNWLFDDIFHELPFKDYGTEVDLVKKLLFKRNKKDIITHVTFNPPENYSGNTNEIIAQWYHRFKREVADRTFEDFNFIEVKGLSLRGRIRKERSLSEVA